MALGKNSAAMAALSRSSHLTGTFSTKALQVQQQQRKSVIKVDHASKQPSFIKKQGIIDAGTERFLKQQLMKGLLLQLSKPRARVLVQIKRLQKEVSSLETQLALTASSPTVAPAQQQRIHWHQLQLHQWPQQQQRYHRP